MANDEITVVYTDGACSGNPGPGGWAWAIPGSAFGSGPADHTTNQRMEITAVLEALRNIDGSVEVVSDSTYVVNCFRDRWWEGWLKRNWQTSAKKPVANKDLWEPLITLVQARKNEISFRWVKGHSGDPMNDFVDALAVEAGKTQKPSSGDKAPSASPTAKPASGGPQAPPGHLLLITGHKPPEIGGYGETETSHAIVAKLREIIAAKAQLHSDLRVITSLGLGVEQLAAQAAIQASVPFSAILPYPDQQSVWPQQSKKQYESLLDQADGEVLLQVSSPDSKQSAGAALNRKNAWLARNASEAIVVWDGNEPFLGKLVRSLQDHLGETEVWIESVPFARQN